MSLCFYLSCPVLYFPIVYTTDRTLLGFNLPITTTTLSYIPLPNRDVTLSVPPPKFVILSLTLTVFQSIDHPGVFLTLPRLYFLIYGGNCGTSRLGRYDGISSNLCLLFFVHLRHVDVTYKYLNRYKTYRN